MSYTPTTWTTGDTVTASAMNKIEQGIAGAGSVANVCVNFNDGGIGGTVGVYVEYARYDGMLDGYSIESPSMDYFSQTPHGRFYIPVCIPKDNDFKAYILFPDYIDNIALYNITGNISSTKIEAHFKVGNNQWESQPYYGFEVSGDGMISVAYND